MNGSSGAKGKPRKRISRHELEDPRKEKRMDRCLLCHKDFDMVDLRGCPYLCLRDEIERSSAILLQTC